MRAQRERGYSLVELILVVTILGLIAAIAIPGRSSSVDKQLNLAAEEFAAAIRFSRTESMRTRTPYGFEQLDGQRRIRVFRLDTSTSPATEVYDVYDPVEKQIYDKNLDQQSFVSAETITRNTLFNAACTTPGAIYFDANGTPWCQQPGDVLLNSFELILQSGTSYRRVVLDGITGRVIVQ